jgi:drug/metabolite transporter (DMT)-like permease
MSSSTPDNDAAGEKRKAGAFDIRNFIAALIGVYGVVLVVYGVIGSSDAQLRKSDGMNINLWAGLGMVLVAALFVTWARLRPVVVAAHPDDEAAPSGH